MMPGIRGGIGLLGMMLLGSLGDGLDARSGPDALPRTPDGRSRLPDAATEPPLRTPGATPTGDFTRGPLVFGEVSPPMLPEDALLRTTPLGPLVRAPCSFGLVPVGEVTNTSEAMMEERREEAMALLPARAEEARPPVGEMDSSPWSAGSEGGMSRVDRDAA